MGLPVCTQGEREDVGADVVVRRLFLDGVLHGLDYWHPCRGGAPGLGYIPLDRAPSGPGWLLESETPLTISPSLLCRACGHHGFIRGGRWVPA